MKRNSIWRAVACLLFACGLFYQPVQSAGQSAEAVPPQPSLRPQTVAPSALERAPLRQTSPFSRGDQVELERARAARVNSTQPALKTAPPAAAVSALDFTPAYTAFLPLVAKPPADLYGLVTFKGAPASSVTVTLRFYDGVANSTVATTTTDANGWYHFLDRPALTAEQEYWIRYNNDENAVDRLSAWFTGIITTYASGERHQFATFDIADLVLNSPASRAVVAPPTVFTWTPRAASPAESYAMWIFDPTGVFTRSYTSGLLGYAGTTSISTIPAGMSLLTMYGWFVELHTADGGYGEPYFYNVLRFGKEGIQGRVTLNGANANNISVQLILEDGSTTSVKDTVSTGSDGIYQFTNAAALTGAQKYYVKYSNTTDSTRLWAWYTAYVAGPYTYGQRAYAGNFDIANMTLGSPNGSLYYPYTFSWTRRPNSPTDKYYLQIYGNGGPYYNGASLGYVNSTSLYGIPSGFSTGVGYGWYVVIESPDYGAGAPYYSSNVTFW